MKLAASNHENILLKLFSVLIMGFIFTNSVFTQQQSFSEEDAGKIAQQFYQQNNFQKENKGNTLLQPAAVQQRYFNGRAANDNLGWCINSAGDVNGDGYDDIIVGAPFADVTGTDNGRAYIYYGGQTPNFIADIVLSGLTDNEHFGKAVASAGDFNGDGFDDVIVGAPNKSPSGDGAVYLFLGGESMNNSADLTIEGLGGTKFGGSVASAGDVNADGYEDIIAGAAPTNAAGHAYIYLGGYILDGTADANMTNNAVGDLFGYSVSSAGDMNGDGYSDVIVGAFNSAGSGQAFIYLGSAVMNNACDQVFSGEGNGDYFGYSLSCAGDVNADGFDDVIVGAWKSDYTSVDAGKAYIYLGASALDGNCDVYLNSENTAYDGFGCAVAKAGDFNGDGFDDVIVGAYGKDDNGSNSGKTYVFFGGSIMNNLADKIFMGETADDCFGAAVGFGGDFNGDGLTEVLVGAWGKNIPAINGGTETVNAGRGYLFTNSILDKDIPDMVLNAPTGSTLSYFGMSVASAGDINGDGYPDIIVGAPRATITQTGQGAAYIYYGGPMMDVANPDLTISIAETGIYFGTSVSTAGDVNGDGYDDFIVGAPNQSTPNYRNGKAYIFFGGYSPDLTPDAVLSGSNDQTDTFFGTSVACAGDVNGDGYSDVVVGEPGRDVDTYINSGRAYLFYGGAGDLTAADLTFGDSPTAGQLGTSVAGAGDVNGDGFSDIIVGGIYGAGDVDPYATGFAYVYYGGSSPNNTIDIVFVGYANGDQFGYSVASAGDVNGDGFSDIIIGAKAAVNYYGRAYLYYGGNDFPKYPASPDVEFKGKDYMGQFGISVASAGDVNGDGFADIVIGAHNNGFTYGEAQVYFGGIVTDTIPDIILEGAQTYSYLGYSVASAGDLNKDGLSDLIIGSWKTTSWGYVNIYQSTSPIVKPRITTISDVPNDQGGKVMVNWIRSGYDFKNINKLTSYEIQRSPASQSGTYSWQNIGSVSPSKDSKYSFSADASYDSMTSVSGTFYFRVIARTSNSNEFWKSNVAAGHSVDNLVPESVSLFRGNPSGGQITLSWRANTEEDLYGYYLYRSAEATIDPDNLAPLTVVQDTSYVDRNPLPGSSYYFIRAKDIHGNYSQLRASSNNPLPVELSMFEAKVNGTTIHLKWRTATEVSLLKFEIEKTFKTNYNWQIVGEIEAHGNSNSPKEYGLTDNLLTVGSYLYRLKMINSDGTFEYSESIEVDVKQPDAIALNQNYPNPFNPVTKIKYQIPNRTSLVTLKVYDILGNEVATLVNEEKEPGYYQIEFDASTYRLSSGVYFYRLQAGENSFVKKLILTK